MAELDVALRLKDETRQGFASYKANLKDAEMVTGRVSQESSKSIGGIGKSAGLSALAIGGIAVAAAGAAAKLVSEFADAGAELRNFEIQSGANAQELQELAFIARDSGGDISDVSDAFREMGIRLGEATALGTGPAIDALDTLGISLQSLQGLAPEQQFDILRDAISGVEDPAQRLFLAEELLGGSTERLGSVLGATSEEIASFREEAARSGAVLDEAAVQKAKEADEALRTLGDAFKGVTAAIAQALTPAVTAAASVVEHATGIIHDNEVAAAELERRNLFLAQAMDEATESTVQLSFGVVEVKGQYEDFDETLERIISRVDTSLEVYGAFRNATADVADETEEASEQIKGLDTDMTGAGGAAIYLAGESDVLTESLRGVANQAAAAAAQVARVRDEIILNARLSQQEALSDEYGLLQQTRPSSVTTPSRRGGGGGGGGSSITRSEEETRSRLEQQLEQLYANNRINEEQYQSLLESNNIGETLNSLIDTASQSELRALDQVRSAAFRIGDLTALSSRSIVSAISALTQTVRAASSRSRGTQAVRRAGAESRDAVGGSRTLDEWQAILGTDTTRGTRDLLDQLSEFGVDTSDRNRNIITDVERFRNVGTVLPPGNNQGGGGSTSITINLEGEQLDARITQVVNAGMASGEITT